MVELDQGGRLAGRAGTRPVAGALTDFAESSFTLDRSNAGDRTWRIVPDLSAHLLVHVEAGRGGAERIRAVVVGARRRYADAIVTRRRLTVGVRLTPGALEALGGLSGGALADRGIALSEFWGDESQRLLDEVAADRRAESVRHSLLGFLSRISRGRRPPDWRVTRFITWLRGARVACLGGVGRELGISNRTLRRTCRRVVGFGPKRMARIDRLYRGIALGIAARPGEGARVAAASGYADQPHMIREFHALVGETPAAFFARRSRPGHIVQ